MTVKVVPILIVAEVGVIRLKATSVTTSAMASVFVISKRKRALPPPRRGRGRLGQRNPAQPNRVVASQRRREGMEGRKVIPSASIDQRSTISDQRLAIRDKRLAICDL